MDADGPKSRMQIEDLYDRRLKDILREMVIDRHMSVAQIVAELGMTEPHVRHWLKHYDLYGVLYDLCPCCGHVIRKTRGSAASLASSTMEVPAHDEER